MSLVWYGNNTSLASYVELLLSRFRERKEKRRRTLTKTDDRLDDCFHVEGFDKKRRENENEFSSRRPPMPSTDEDEVGSICRASVVP